MFTIRRGKFEYYSEDGGFITIAEFPIIKWYPHYVTASQQAMKLCEKDVHIVPATEVLEEVIKGLFGLAPELIEFSHSRTIPEMEEVARITDLIALRGGMLELKDRIVDLNNRVAELEREKAMLMSEAQKLVVVMDDYKRTIVP